MQEHIYDDEIKGRIYDSRLMKRLLVYARKYTGWIVLAVVLLIVASLLEIMWPQLVRLAVDKYIENPAMSTDEKLDGVLMLSIVYLVTLVLSVLLNYLQIIIMNFTGQNVLHDIRMDLFRHVESLSVNFFTKNPVGRLVTRLTNDIAQLNELFTTGLVGVFGDVIMLVSIVIIMLWMNVKLALISFSVLPFIILSVVLFRYFLMPVYLEIRKYLARVNAFIQEHISGVKIVQMFDREEKTLGKFDSLNKEHLLARARMIKIHGVFMPVVEALSYLAISVILYYGAKNIYKGEMEIGMLIAFLMYCRRFYRPVMDLSQKYTILQDAMTSSTRIFSLMDTKDIIEDPQAPLEMDGKVRGRVQYKDIWFAYNNDEWVLKGVNLEVKEGEKIALVGVTGSGKTTIVNLLARFYDYQKGSILLDGRELKNFTKYDIRRQLAYVHQDFFLFAGTILDNIKLWNNNITDEEAIEAAKIVNVSKFAEELPNKYNEQVLEGGSNLSTGQKQLISFARALAFKPSILILDEATSNIDSETEKLIQDALEKLLARQTSIIIAHRLSTIKNVDRILVMHKGEIVEEGSHDQLLRKDGIYSNLYKLQYKETEG